MRAATLLLAALSLSACHQKPGDSGDPTSTIVDADGDGYALDADCDDEDPTVNAGADEVCDGIDNNCDDAVDEGLATSVWYPDGDGDGYGGEGATVESCRQPAGYAEAAGDCDDANSAFHPGAAEGDCTDPNDYNCDGSVGATDADGDGFFACEECDDRNLLVNPKAAEVCNGVDDNCDTVVDTDAVDASTWYADADGDGYGDDDGAITSCDRPADTVAAGGDCDDTSAAYHPGAEEACDDPADYNCDGSVGYADVDGDGYPACHDCADGNPEVHTGATEICDGWDNDCDGRLDVDAVDALTWYADGDGDGYGDAGVTQQACSQPSGYVATGDDCDDLDAAYNPAASEACDDTVDYNCDGSVGYADGDGDGVPACEDCDDGNPAAAPGLDELCDGVDNNCDGVVDEATAAGAPTWYADVDGDGYGDDGAVTTACDQPTGFVAVGGDCADADAAYNPGAAEACTDTVDYNCDGSIAYADADGDGYAACEECDDAEAGVYPGATEICDGLDNDCDGTVDGAGAAGTSTWYFDGDGDGYGTDAVSVEACDAPSNYVALGGDCDDTDANFAPDAEESCEEPVDYNCDGSTTYDDADGDGVPACEDCDDADPAVNPSGVEACDGVDNDCDGNVDETGALGETTWYPDGDADGYGDAAAAQLACDAPVGFVVDGTDCDDASAASFPGNPEVCDLRDNDCDGTVDDDPTDGSTWYVDADLDGYGDPENPVEACSMPVGATADDTDCDDGDVTIHPGRGETCDGVDQDCDGVADDGAIDGDPWYADTDADGYGDPDSSVDACEAPAGYVADATDCDPVDGANHPGALEWCDGVDNDCDTTVDEDAADGLTWYADDDGDGFGATEDFVEACEAPSGYLADYADCDDTRASVNPDGVEVCNGLDDDCSGTIDDGATDASTWYADADEDGYGAAASTTTACDAPEGYVATATDCDDGSDTIHPGASETCNDTDDDCDGSTDESAVDRGTWYLDGDGDGYGTATSTLACDAPAGYAAASGDCDDTTVDANPGEAEVCNDTLDNDCDGTDNGCSIAGSLAATTADWTLRGAASNDYLGSAVAGGDVTGDGYADTIVGAYGWDSAGSGSRNDGRVYVHHGNVTGIDTTTTADTTISSSQSNANLGQAVAFLGDTDGDTYGDYAVAAYKYDVTSGSTITDAGAVFLFTSRPSGSITETSADTVVQGVAANDWTGFGVVGAGDVDDDGYADVLVSSNQANVGANADAGSVALFLGPLAAGSVAASAGDTIFEGREANEQIGFALAADGDYDGDGYSDVAIGAHLSDTNGADAGVVYVFYGPTAAGTVSVNSADIRIYGAATGDQLGRAVAWADTEGDGTDDLVVGADYADNGAAVNAGAAYVFASGTGSGSASTASATFTGVTGSDYVGRAAANAGDVDGDLAEDILVSATGYDNGATSGVGCTYLLYGPFSGTQALSTYDARIRGSTAADAVGYAAAGAGDVDDDGFADVFVSAIGADSSSLSNNGAAWLFFGGGY